MRSIYSMLIGAALVLSAPTSSFAQSAIDSLASVIDLRSTCAMPNGATLDNCFETTADVTDWLWAGGRASEPNSLDPVTVRVGPGSFDPFSCTAGQGMRGFVSVEGAGRDVTEFFNPSDVIGGPDIAFVCEGGITVRGCTQLSFSRLRARGLGSGVIWNGDGDSQWENVDMLGDNEGVARCLQTAMGWYDVTADGGVHFFWNTRFEARGSGTFVTVAFNGRTESWIYGSDLLARVDHTGGGGVYAAILASGTIGTRIFGSTLRAKATNSQFGGLLSGIDARGGQTHMHGGIINVDASATSGGTAAGIRTSTPTTFVHTPETAFVLKSAQANLAYRIVGPGDVDSPFLWPSGTTPPNILSQTGSDLFVKTDEGPGQNEARLFIYDSSCTTSPWRNVTTGDCL